MLFDPIKLDFRLGDRSIASVSVDGSCDETDFYSVVSVREVLNEKRIYGVDPVSALSAGLRLVETLTEEIRFSEEVNPSDLRVLLERT